LKNSDSRFGSTWGYRREPTDVEVTEYAIKKLNEAWIKDKEIHERNIPLLEANKALIKEIEAYMLDVGFPTSYSEPDPKSRARFPKRITILAGWKNDITKNIITTDKYSEEGFEKLLAKWNADLVSAQTKEKYDAEAANREKEALKKKKIADMKLASFLVKYNLDVEDEWEDVLDFILDKDKNLKLAHAMYQTRNNWSEGFYRVENALNSYAAYTDEEIAIDEMVSEACYGEERDGRIFRDMKYSYDYLFGLVNDDLMKDYNECMENVDDDF